MEKNIAVRVVVSMVLLYIQNNFDLFLGAIMGGIMGAIMVVIVL